MYTEIVKNAGEIGTGIAMGQASIQLAPPSTPAWVHIATALIPIVANSLVSIIKSVWGTPEQRAERKRLREQRRENRKALRELRK